jgi:hypothetical protein
MFILFCWLNWWVMPYLAIVRLDEKEAQIPKTCYLLMGQKDNNILGLRIIKGLEYGWDGVPAAWPYMLAGMIPALGIGYCVGELARRKFAIDAASKEAISIGKECQASAVIEYSKCENLREKLAKEVRQFDAEKAVFEEMRSELQLEKIFFEKWIKTFESGELSKAKSTIKKLGKKLSDYR